MELTDRVINFLKERRKRILEGDINCIPLPFERFREELPGIEQGSYYLVSGQTKAGKSQLANYLFVYNTIFYAFEHKDKIKPVIFYYPLEETAESITLRFMAYLLYKFSEGKIRISPTDLKSTNAEKPLDESILKILEEDKYKEILKFYEECVIFKDSRNPTGKKDLEVKKIYYIFAENLNGKDYDWYL